MIRNILVRLLLERAIVFEERAYRFYEAALERAVMSESAVLLKKLLAEELRHRMKLEEVQKSGDMRAMTDDAAEGEVPADAGSSAAIEDFIEENAFNGLNGLSGEWPVINPWARRREILEIAISKETNACRFYETLSARTRLKTAREVFSALSREESAHVNWLRRELEKTAP